MRTISSEASAALNSGRFGVRAIVKISPTGSDPLCFWDDVGSIEYEGDTYVGAAGRFTVEAATSSADLSIRSCELTFSGLDAAAIAMIEGVEWHQRPILVQRLAFAIDTPQILHVWPEFAGVIDQMIWTEASNDGPSTLVLQCESMAREFSLRNSRTASDADQRERSSTDGFFSFAQSAVSTSIDWGRNPTAPPQKSGGISGFLDKIF